MTAELSQAIDYREECDALHALLATAEDSDWSRPTQFKAWTLDDILGHLHLFDLAALATLEGPEGFANFLADSRRFRAEGGSMREYTRHWLGALRNRSLLAKWFETSGEVARCFLAVDPALRVNWGPGPAMSARSLISARQMEVWAHGQAAYDLLDVERVEADRLHNVAVMGVNTFGWSFTNRKLEKPSKKPHVRLVSPSGAIWTWNDPDPECLVEGTAVDFCRVVAQTRNVADARLKVVGDVARTWMSIAQCFAGPPEAPPAPGSRGRGH
jgi:uncharacterized protein (TIGR03084 family)